MLDELTAAGEVVWAGHGALAGHDGLVSLHPAAVADLTLPPPADAPRTRRCTTRVLEALGGGGAWFLGALTDRVRQLRPDDASPSQADVVRRPCGTSSGPGTSPTTGSPRCARGWAAGAPRTGRARPTPRGRPLRPRLGLRAAVQLAGDPGTPVERARAERRRERRPVVAAARRASRTRRCARTRWPPSCSTGTASSPGPSPRPRASAPGSPTSTSVLSALEQGGQVRRGYFVERLGGSQFALPGAVDRLRVDAQVVERSADQDGPTDLQVVVLAATDPANPYGASLPWPVAGPDPTDAGAGRHRPGRKGGALVVLVDGALVLYLERGGRTVLSFTSDARVLAAAADGLATTARTRHTGRLTIARVDGVEVLDGALHGTARPGARRRGLRADPARPAPAGPVVTAAPVPEGDVLRRTADRFELAIAGQVAGPVRPALADGRDGRPGRHDGAGDPRPTASTC